MEARRTLKGPYYDPPSGEQRGAGRPGDTGRGAGKPRSRTAAAVHTLYKSSRDQDISNFVPMDVTPQIIILLLPYAEEGGEKRNKKKVLFFSFFFLFSLEEKKKETWIELHPCIQQGMLCDV